MKNAADLQARLKTFAAKTPQPEVQIRGDANSHFEAVGRVLYAVQQSGLSKVGFITEPDTSTP
jgi:biopolymer transport protein ExbD